MAKFPEYLLAAQCQLDANGRKDYTDGSIQPQAEATAFTQARCQPVSQQGISPLHDKSHRNHQHPQTKQLQRDRPRIRTNELGQKGHEKDGCLGIEDINQHALLECLKGADFGHF